jgi:hypothetical protein
MIGLGWGDRSLARSHRFDRGEKHQAWGEAGIFFVSSVCKHGPMSLGGASISE